MKHHSSSQRISGSRWALLVALATFAGGCRQSAPPSPDPDTGPQADRPAKVAVGVVRAQRLEETVQLPATVQSDETAMLMARAESYVNEVLVDIGDEVEAGQVLIRLDAPELEHRAAEQAAMVQRLHADKQVRQAELQAAHTQLDVVRAELTLKNSERDRLARLVSSGAIDRQRLEEADSSAQSVAATLARFQNSVQVAEVKLLRCASEMAVVQSKLQAAEALVSYLEIKAPFAGIVARRDVDPGNLVRPATQGSGATPLLTLAKVDMLRVVVHATVDVAGKMTVGDSVTFVPDDMPDNALTAELSRAAGAYDDKTRMMRAEIDLENAPDPATGRRPLRAGSYGSAIILLEEATLPVVPESALLRRGSETSVVVVRDRVCGLTAVDIAMESDGLVGIRAGIAAGDLVVVKNPEAVAAGQKLGESQIELVTW